MHRTGFVASYFDAWNHRDPEEVATHLAPNGRYWDVPQNVERTHDELIEYLDRFFAAFQHRYELKGRVLTDRNSIAFQYRMIPSDCNENTNETTYHGAEFITLRDDAALMITDYYDVVDTQTPVPPRPAESPLELRKYTKSGLDEQRLLEYKNRLEDVMRSQKPFLQPGLTLPRLAGAVDCSVNHLSQVINSGFNMSFFEYLNKYRVECATELMTDADRQCPAILDIAYTVGFNSISAFYSAFKKHVGQTPARYRSEQLQRESSASQGH